jgi:hypothetical protein
MGPQVHHQQPVPLLAAEITQHEHVVREGRAVNAGPGAHHRIAVTKGQQVVVQRQGGRVHLALARIELAPLECRAISGIGQLIARPGGDARELGEKLRAAATHGRRQRGGVIGEVEERPGRRELLPLEQQRCPRAQQQQRRHGAQAPGRGQRVQSRPGRGIRDLIVVLQIRHEARGLDAEGRCAATLPLPGVPLALIEIAPPRRRDELARGASVVRVVGLAAAGERDAGAVMEVVVPHAVETIAALGG